MVTYISTTHYNKSNIIYWIWYFRKYKFIKGFTFRIFGINFNIKENNATQKLLFKWRRLLNVD